MKANHRSTVSRVGLAAAMLLIVGLTLTPRGRAVIAQSGALVTGASHNRSFTGEWFGDSGSQNENFTVPQGMALTSMTLTVHEGSASLASQPAEGATGSIQAVVNWSYGWFGRCRYRISAAWAAFTQTTQTSVQEHTGAWFGESGEDQVSIALPDCHELTDLNLEVLEGDAEISSQPATGSSGTVTVGVAWSYGWFGKARYRLKAFSTATADYGIEASNLSSSPDPAVAGSAVTLSATVENVCENTIDELDLEIELYALSVDDIPQFILDQQTDADRTQTLTSSVSADLDPGETKTISTDFDVPAKVGDDVQISPAGTYRATVRLIMPSGDQLYEEVIDNWQIVDP